MSGIAVQLLGAEWAARLLSWQLVGPVASDCCRVARCGTVLLIALILALDLLLLPLKYCGTLHDPHSVRAASRPDYALRRAFIGVYTTTRWAKGEQQQSLSVLRLISEMFAWGKEVDIDL